MEIKRTGLKNETQKIGRKIRLARQLCDYTLEDLSLKLEVSYQQLQKYENGKNRVPAVRLLEIAQALDYPIAFFFGREGEEDLPLPDDVVHTARKLHSITNKELQTALNQIIQLIS